MTKTLKFQYNHEIIQGWIIQLIQEGQLIFN